MEKYDIERIEEEMKALTVRYEVACNLVKCGIPRNMTKFWTAPMPESGYSMGEVVRITCNGTLIQLIDNTQEYARSCKWKAKHGNVLISFNKKELREALELMKASELISASNHTTLKEKVVANKALCSFVLAHIDKEKSELKKMPTDI